MLRIDVPQVGQYVLARTSRVVSAEIADDIPADAAEDAFFGTVIPLAVQATTDFEVVHASAVLVDGRGVSAFCGASGSGKSTIASGLTTRGHRQWADDAVAFSTRGTSWPAAVSLPFVPKLRPASAAVLGPPLAVPTSADRSSAPLVAIFILERAVTTGAQTSIARVDPARALPKLLAHAYQFQPQRAMRRRAMVSAYLDVVTAVPVLELRFASDLSRLAELLDAVELAMAEQTGSPSQPAETSVTP